MDWFCFMIVTRVIEKCNVSLEHFMFEGIYVLELLNCLVLGGSSFFDLLIPCRSVFLVSQSLFHWVQIWDKIFRDHDEPSWPQTLGNPLQYQCCVSAQWSEIQPWNYWTSPILFCSCMRDWCSGRNSVKRKGVCASQLLRPLIRTAVKVGSVHNEWHSFVSVAINLLRHFRRDAWWWHRSMCWKSSFGVWHREQ